MSAQPKPIKTVRVRKPMRRSLIKPSSRSRERLRKDAAWSRQVRERDDYRCQFPFCGEYNALNEAHHIGTRRRYPELRWAVENGICLCDRHHSWIHSHGKEAEALGLLIPGR